VARPHLTLGQVDQVATLVSQYITAQRETYVSQAVPLSGKQREAVGEFFSPQILDSVRLVVLRGKRIGNPDFYPMLRGMGFHNLPDQSNMAAITFGDVVVSHETFSNGLLFHELVHAEQYRQLGIQRFSQLYVRGFLKRGSYEAIPLEVNAYTLEGRFEADPRESFSVEQEVKAWAERGRF
jgi:hypothetical protein